MTQKTYTVEMDAAIYGDGTITDEAGQPISSATLYQIARNIESLADVQARKEKSLTLQPGKLYIYRAKRAVHYLIVDEVANDSVKVFKADKAGVRDNEPSFAVYDVRRLVLAKNQPRMEALAA